jgi:hypothetical protein
MGYLVFYFRKGWMSTSYFSDCLFKLKKTQASHQHRKSENKLGITHLNERNPKIRGLNTNERSLVPATYPTTVLDKTMLRHIQNHAVAYFFEKPVSL